MMFLRNSILLLTSFVARRVMAQPLRAFDNNADHRSLQAPFITVVAVTRPTTDEILTTFTHGGVTAPNTVSKSYLNADCTAALTLAGTDFETVSLATDGATTSTVKNLISQIYDEMTITSFTPTAGAPAGADRGEQFSYCVRLTYTIDGVGIADFREVIITYKAYFDENGVSLGGTVSGTPNGPDSGGVDSDLLTVSARACDGSGVALSPVTISEGNAQRFCVYADQHPTTGMVSINTFSFSGTPQGGTLQTQAAIAGGTTTDVLTTVDTCVAGKRFCTFTTTLKGEFYQKTDGSRVTTNTAITGSGTVTIRIGGIARKARLLLMLKSGDEVVKETSKVEFMAAPKEERCDCSGTFFLFKIFCWIFKCLLGF